MNWYRENYSEWKEIIETVAREMGRTEQLIEKDIIQSMFLYELSKSELPFVFKGETSLTKAYDLIERFSEDIDLSMNRRPTQSERVKSKDRFLRQIYSTTGECRIHAIGFAPNVTTLESHVNYLLKNTKGIRRFSFNLLLTTIKDVDGGVEYVRYKESEHLEENRQ